MIQKKVVIPRNDTYVLTKTKDYIIINDNYTGIKIYTPNLEFISDLYIFEDLVIWKIFSDQHSNKVVIFDDGCYEKIYIVDLDQKENNIKDITFDITPLNYYLSTKKGFCVVDDNYRYYFAYNLKLIEKTTVDYDGIVMANYQNKLILYNDGKLFYQNYNEKCELRLPYGHEKYYAIFNDTIAVYTEKLLEIYDENEKIYQYKVTENQRILSGCCDGKCCYLLIDDEIKHDTSYLLSFIF